MRTAYFDVFAGASGDMVLGTLLDAGLPLTTLQEELRKLPLTGYRIESRPAQRGVIHGTQAQVILEPLEAVGRNLSDIVALIDESNIPEAVKPRAVQVFRRLAEAEARVHRIGPEEVHFHEVGAVDAIVDIVGSALGLHLLGVEEVYCSPLPTGAGFVRAAHGVLPVPAPATLELLSLAKAPLRPETPGLAPAEVLTPTGAAILTTLCSFDRPAMSLEAIGHGIGARELPDWPNALRLWLGEKAAETGAGGLVLLETNIDDMSPELLGYAMERLFALGARDVWFTPIQMKKNRPAVMLSAIAGAELEGPMVEAMLRETTTLGMRVRPVARHESRRESFSFQSSLGPATVKVKHLPGAAPIFAPEYEDCRRLALERGLPLQDVYRLVSDEARQAWEREKA